MTSCVHACVCTCVHACCVRVCMHACVYVHVCVEGGRECENEGDRKAEKYMSVVMGVSPKH